MYLTLNLQRSNASVALIIVLISRLSFSNDIFPSGFTINSYIHTPLPLSWVSPPDNFIIFALNPK
jgi:hypothetical protein